MQGATVTIIQSTTGHLFGGYAGHSWNTKLKFYGSYDSTFIFTLINPHNIQPTPYYCPEDCEEVLLGNVEFGPTFGKDDVEIYDLSNTRKNYLKFPTSFLDSTSRGVNTFTGDSEFYTREWEVYTVI